MTVDRKRKKKLNHKIIAITGQDHSNEEENLPRYSETARSCQNKKLKRLRSSRKKGCNPSLTKL